MSDKRTCRKNIDYKIFSETGERVLKTEDVEPGINSKPKMEIKNTQTKLNNIQRLFSLVISACSNRLIV